jgi:hypothetical protein
MKRLTLLVIVTALGSCAAASQHKGADGCDAARAQSLIGQSASSELAVRARRLTGAAVVRWLRPGQIVTMEFRADRLSIVLDAGNTVQAIRCG